MFFEGIKRLLSALTDVFYPARTSLYGGIPLCPAFLSFAACFFRDLIVQL
jgi:hypothetical protein